MPIFKLQVKTISKFLLIISSVFIFCSNVYAQTLEKKTLPTDSPNYMPSKLFGLTIDESSFDEIELGRESNILIENILNELRIIQKAQPNNNSLTVRIVLPVGCEKGKDCDSSEVIKTNKLDPRYLDLIKKIKAEKLAFIMAEIIDSDIESSTACFNILNEQKSIAMYLERTKKLYDKLGQYVDIWEIGNEINGDWFGGAVTGIVKNETRRKIVVGQLKAAYDFLDNKKVTIQKSNVLNNKDEKYPLTALTFYFNGGGKNKNSYENINDAMHLWMLGIGKHFLDKKNNKITFTNLDYLLISYYPDDNFYEPNPSVSDFSTPIHWPPKDWVDMFDSIKYNYSSNTKFGLGEMGTQCYFYNKPTSVNAKNNCTTLRLDLLKNGRNPCDKYNANGEVIKARTCPCCYDAQVSVIKEYYTNLDAQISEEMKKNNNFKSADRFIGGYFNWYYSADVINKMVKGTTQEKAQAEKVRNAIIEAYKKY